MSTAVILAAGRSSRSGRIHKGLRSLRSGGQSRSWLQHQIRQLRRAGFRRIKLATGYRPRPLLAHALPAGATQAHNPQPARGPFSSLQQALKGFNSQHTLLVPLDNPVPAPAVLFRIRRALCGKQVAKPSFNGRGGHPLLLHKSLVQRLQKVSTTDETARLDLQLRQLCQSQIAHVGVRTPQVRTNLNTPRQWQHYRQTFGRALARH